MGVYQSLGAPTILLYMRFISFFSAAEIPGSFFSAIPLGTTLGNTSSILDFTLINIFLN